MVLEENKIDEVENIKREIDNLDISNYKKIYGKFKNVFRKNRGSFNYYVDKLIELMKNLNNDKLAREIDNFMLYILEDGILWRFKVEGIVSSLSIKDNVVILGDNSGHVYALDVNTGKKLWGFRAESGVNDLFIKDNRVILKSWRGYVYILDFNTGSVLWKSKSEERVLGLSLKDNIVIVELSGKCIYAFDIMTGAKLWEFEREEYLSSLSVKDNVVILEFGESDVYVLDIKTGEKILEFEGWYVCNLSINEDIVIVGCENENVYALDVDVYSKIQKVKPQLISLIQQPPIITNLTLLRKSFNLNKWDKLPIQITNTSIKDIIITKISIISDGILFKDIEPIKIKGGETKTINVLINPKVKGSLPITVEVEYEDEFNMPYKYIIDRFKEVLTITETEFKED